MSSVGSATASYSSRSSSRRDLKILPDLDIKDLKIPQVDDKKLKIKRLTPSARREVELKNHARKLAGLSLITIKVRKCISCGKLFESSGNRNCGCQSRRAGFIAGREII